MNTIVKTEPSKSNLKTFNRYIEIMKKGTWGENDIIAFRKAIGGSSTLPVQLRETLLEEFYKKMPERGYKITQEQSIRGIAWLLKYTFKKNGEIRAAKNMSFGHRECEILKKFKNFTFIGVQNQSSNNYAFYLPVYKVVSKNKSSFEYTTNMGLIEALK